MKLLNEASVANTVGYVPTDNPSGTAERLANSSDRAGSARFPKVSHVLFIFLSK